MSTRVFSGTIGDERGITLIELLVVISVVVILVAISLFSYQGWAARYKIEGDVRVLYSDLMNARARAIQRSRMHCVSFTAVSNGYEYSIRDDTAPSPDGNGSCADAGDTVLPSFPKRILYDIAPAPLEITFNQRGLANTVTAFQIIDTGNSGVDPDYDCIEVLTTRINMGLWDGGTSDCEAK